MPNDMRGPKSLAPSTLCAIEEACTQAARSEAVQIKGCIQDAFAGRDGVYSRLQTLHREHGVPGGTWLATSSTAKQEK